MKQTITINDLDKIAGHFILQLNADKPIKLTDHGVDLEFYLSKRVDFVCYGGDGIVSSDLHGNSHTYTKEKFVDMFNNYLGDSKGTRYHRLLYGTELEVVFKFLMKRYY